ncbi:MAG: ATP phosphoribosyltransferase regulatory subunit [Thermoanaerobaculia bacterium]
MNEKTDIRSETRESPFPVGVRVLLVEETRRRKRIERAAAALLESSGFDEVTLPVVDFADPYAGVISPADFRAAYRFTDASGELLAVRADFTPMLARAVAPLVREREGALRLFYRGDVVRRERVRLGRSRECFQIGAELIGDASPAADAEMIRLAVAVARACGASPVAALSHAGLLPLLAASSGGSQRLRSIVRSRRRMELASMPLDARARPLIEALVDGTLTPEALAAFPPAEEIASRLIALREELRGEVELSLDEDGEASYYSGIRFRVYDQRRLIEIGAGGRYDTLYGEFGASAPAVGFTITTDALEEDAR